MADVSESLLMRPEKLEATYGGGFYPDEALKPAGEKIWAELEDPGSMGISLEPPNYRY